MTLTQFIKKYQGKQVDFDKAFGYQCVDLFRQYCVDVLGIEEHTGGVEGARELFTKYDSLPVEKKYFKRTIDSVTADYSIGDVLIWDGNGSNKYGHVAILVAIYNTKYFVVFEQDGFKQDGAKLVLRSRENLLGCLWKV